MSLHESGIFFQGKAPNSIIMNRFPYGVKGFKVFLADGRERISFNKTFFFNEAQELEVEMENGEVRYFAFRGGKFIEL